MKTLALALATLLLTGIAASAQPVAPACSLVCFPPQHLNARKCTCEEPVSRKPACSLVCLDPEQTLDARKCACVRRH